MQTVGIHAVYDTLHAPLLKQCDSGTESYELAHTRHVNAVIVGITHLRGRAYYHNFLGMQTVKHTDDRLFQSGAAHNGVIDHHKIVTVVLDAPVCHIIYMRRKIIARVSLGDESAQLDILYRDLFHTQSAVKQFCHALRCHCPLFLHPEQLRGLHFVEIAVEPVHKTDESHLGRVWDEREHGVVNIAVHRPYYFRHKKAPEFLTLAVYVGIAAA